MTAVEARLEDDTAVAAPEPPRQRPRRDGCYRQPPPIPEARAGEGWVRRLLPLFRPYRLLLVMALLGAIGSMVLRVQVPNVTMRGIDRALIAGEEPIGGYAWLLAAMAVGILGCGIGFRYTLQRIAYDIEYTLRVLLFQQFTRLSFSFYDRVHTGQLVSRANSDVRQLQMFLAFGPMMGITFVSFCAALVMMVRIHVPLTLVTLCVLPLVYGVAHRMNKWLFPVSWLVSARQAEIATIVEENVGGTQVVRSFAAERHQITALDRAAQRLRWAAVRMADLRARYGPLVQNLPRVGLALLLLYGGWLAIDGQITVGALFAFNAYVMLIQLPFMMLGFMIMAAQRAAAAAQRILEILDERPELQDAPDAVALTDCLGDVELRGVRFGYGDEDVPVLDGLDLHVRPGETVALVGRTGSGKSTIARLVPRFYDVADGAVLVDGVDVRHLTVESLRANVGLVLDDSFLFTGTIRDNIAFGRPEASDEEVTAAARAAGAEDFILRMPDGYDTLVGERGSTLSGGQRQRVAIARTLLVNPRILILDDCTSSIDAHREHEIHDALRTLMAGRTTFIIAHRLSTISLAERVVMLDGGRIVADGTHEQLLRDVPAYAEVLSHTEQEWQEEHRRVLEREAHEIDLADIEEQVLSDVPAHEEIDPRPARHAQHPGGPL